jgi:biopolymer transport protein ExbD
VHCLACLLLLLADPVDSTVTLPLAPSASVDPGPSATNRIILNLTRHGQVRVGGKQRSLKELLAWFAIEAYPKPRTNKNVPRVLLRVDRDAPWQHVMHVASVLQRSGLKQVEFGVRLRADRRDSVRRTLQAGVQRSTDSASPEGYFAVRLRPHQPIPTTLIEKLRTSKDVRRDRLILTSEREVSASWGPKATRKAAKIPLNVRVEWNGRPTYSPRVLRAWIRSSVINRARAFISASAARTRVIVGASEKVPARYVIASMSRLRTQGWREIWFFVSLSHTASRLRSAPSLPYPKTNGSLAGDDGLDEVLGERVSSSDIR